VRICAAAAIALLFVACGGSAPAPVAEPQPETHTAPAPQAASTAERVIGTVRVSASTLNVRREASTSADVLGHARRGERLAIIEDSGDWLRVRLNDGTTGWVSSQHVTRDGAAARPRRSGCSPDSDYSFVTTPKPSFSENGPHGIVVIEASVNVQGVVTSTRVVSNETHDETLATIAEREIRTARFNPPIRNCTPRAFFFTYKRAF
jgi:uncharacterized protein YgiM (DUF1202 family)